MGVRGGGEDGVWGVELAEQPLGFCPLLSSNPGDPDNIWSQGQRRILVLPNERRFCVWTELEVKPAAGWACVASPVRWGHSGPHLM